MPVISYDRLDNLGDVVGIEQVTLEMEFESDEERTRPALSLRVEEFTEPQWTSALVSASARSARHPPNERSCL